MYINLVLVKRLNMARFGQVLVPFESLESWLYDGINVSKKLIRNIGFIRFHKYAKFRDFRVS